MQPKKYAPWLTGLWLLFVLRVAGQFLVSTGHAGFLPPMEEWYSGVISYPRLLLSQIFLIIFMGTVCLRFLKGEIPKNSGLGRVLMIFGILYLGIMAVRYILRMELYPQERWCGGSIPIFFHWVLAGFVLVWSHYHIQGTRPRETRGVFIFGKAAAAVAGILFFAVWLAWQTGPSFLAHRLGFQPPAYPVRQFKSVKIPMQDSALLNADLYLPKTREPKPAILVRINFGDSFRNRLFSNFIGRVWAERGYNVIFQGVRGRYRSQGKYEPFIHERQDGIETLQWLKRQPWYDGRVVMWGGSYFGYTQWAVADQKALGLKALFIQISAANFYEMFYPGGVFSFENALDWAVCCTERGEKFLSAEKMQKGFLHLPLKDAENQITENTDYYDQWAASTRLDDPYWKAIDMRGRIPGLAAPVFLMAGWFDPFLPPQLEDYESILRQAPPEIARQTRLVIGPWNHAGNADIQGGGKSQNYRLASLQWSLPWFDALLNGKPEKIFDAPVKIFVMGINRWRFEREWPLKRTEYRDYFLAAAPVEKTGRLSPDQGNKNTELSFIYDPAHPAPSLGGSGFGKEKGMRRQGNPDERNDILFFDTLPLTQDMEITGPVHAELFVATTALATDFTVKLVDVHPDGEAFIVSDGIRKQRFDFGTRKIRVDLWPTSMVFFKNHKIRIEVSSSNFPRFARDLNTGEKAAKSTRMQTARQTLYCGGMQASKIVLPVIPETSR